MQQKFTEVHIFIIVDINSVVAGASFSIFGGVSIDQPILWFAVSWDKILYIKNGIFICSSLMAKN